MSVRAIPCIAGIDGQRAGSIPTRSNEALSARLAKSSSSNTRRAIQGPSVFYIPIA
jgi:hypothetical protein